MVGVLVHEWLAKRGGSEQVFMEMANAFPSADIFTLWDDLPDRFLGRQASESWLARTPLRKSKALALPLMLPTWRYIPSPDESYDWVLVSSHLFAHHARFVRPSRDLKKFVYVHTPARYLWNPDLDTRANSPFLRPLVPSLKRIDRKRTKEGSVLVANSQYVRQRIRVAWDRDAEVIYPPVQTEAIQAVADWADTLSPMETQVLDSIPSTFLLGASRFVSYKELDMVIRAGEASDLPVVIAGSGPDEARLRDLASVASIPVHFIIAPSDSLLYALYQRALVYMFPPVEDFGIMPVEAMACGTPVVANVEGGAQESVSAPIGGALFERESISSLQSAIDLASSLHRDTVANHAASFSAQRFRREIVALVGGSSE